VQWTSTVSVSPDLETAVAEAGDAVRAGLGNATPDLLVAFVSPHHSGAFERLPALIRSRLGGGLLVGCSAGGVIGGGREIEHRQALSLTAAVLPDVTIEPVRVDPETPAAPDVAAEHPHLILLPDPFTVDTESVVQALDATFPDATTVGGVASGGQQPGSNALYLGDETYRSGLVGIALSGDVAVDTIVAQGCRPIGEPMFVTRSDRNVVHTLDGRPALAVVRELRSKATPADEPLFRASLFLGIVMTAGRESYRQGDFLVRNIIGADPSTGAIAVGALVEEGMVVQFHLRDAATSAADLDSLLARYEGRPAGALLFSCLGRGAALYGSPDHDTNAFRNRLGPVPLGGFFCNGEIGPVHGTTFLHGYTSAFALFHGR
jgi:small ligand-binding sensory domain FIST